MEPSPYVTDFERQRQLLFDRYMRLRQNYVYESSDERYQWVEAARKIQYHPLVKVNNWKEEQSDVDFLKQRRSLGSDYDYAYKSEYLSRFGDGAGEQVKTSYINHKCFPGHQPELDLPLLKRVYNSFETTSRVAYQDPGKVTARQNETTCTYCRLHKGHVQN